MLLEVFDDLAAIVDCGLDEVLPGADDDFLLVGHGVSSFLGWFLIWNCSPFQACAQVVHPVRTSCVYGGCCTPRPLRVPDCRDDRYSVCAAHSIECDRLN